MQTTTATQENFFQDNDPFRLVETYGSPLYVYNESILRENCRRLKNMVTYPKFYVSYSAKANCNLALLQIVRQEGLHVDAMSPGEIYVQQAAGFTSDQIFFVCNNVALEEMRYAMDNGILVSVDSLSQLELFGKNWPGERVAVRFNPGIGAGGHEKIITGGKEAKFGINLEYLPQVKNVLERYNLRLTGINQHIGSLFMDPDKYIESIRSLLETAKHFPHLELIDFGGGFGIPYRKMEGEKPLDLQSLGEKLDLIMADISREYGKELTFAIEPGRYIPAEAGRLLGTVHAVKTNGPTKYVGCDVGFTVLVRPAMYDSHHDIAVHQRQASTEQELVTVVGNICESGDHLAKNRMLPKVTEGDLLDIYDAGSYGFVMSSNYNNRLRPAEVLIREDGSVVLIRKRDALEDLIRHNFLLEDALEY